MASCRSCKRWTDATRWLGASGTRWRVSWESVFFVSICFSPPKANYGRLEKKFKMDLTEAKKVSSVMCCKVSLKTNHLKMVWPTAGYTFEATTEGLLVQGAAKEKRWSFEIWLVCFVCTLKSAGASEGMNKDCGWCCCYLREFLVSLYCETSFENNHPFFSSHDWCNTSRRQLQW